MTQKKPTNENYTMELGKMMCQFLEKKTKESKHVKMNLKEKFIAEEENSDVEMAENYMIDIINQFLNLEASKEIFNMTRNDKEELSHKTKKNWSMDWHEGVAQEVNHELKIIQHMQQLVLK